MASHNQPSASSIPHFCIHTTATTTTIATKNTHASIQALPERFRAFNRLQPTSSNNKICNYYSHSNNNNNSNKLYNKYFTPYRQALQHTLHAIVLTLLALLFSDWIAQASVAAAVPTQQRRYELPTQNLPKRAEHAAPSHLVEPIEPLLSIAVTEEEDDFNSSSYLTASIQSTTNLVRFTAIAEATAGAGTGSGARAPTAAANINGSRILSVDESSISSQHVAANIYGGGGGGSGVAGVSASAALITTSSIWDPIVGGAYPTDISIAQPAPAQPPPQPTPTPPQQLQGSNEVEDEQLDDYALPPWHAAIVCIILMVIIIGTVIGNVLVCIAVCMVRKLRRPCNYLLVSLALSDLCVALLVMPMAMLYEVLDKWNFGPILCDIWVSFDVLCCTASILNLCAISVDRYLAITKPLEYGVKRTPRRMMACVALVWLAAASISLPPLLILGNEHVDEHGTPICIVCQNFAYQIYATLGSFYIPLSVMLFVYYQIFRAARRIVLEEKRAQTHLQHALNGTSAQQPQPLLQPAVATPLPGNTDLTVFGGNGGGGGANSGNGGQQCRSSYGNTSLTYSTCGTLSAHHASGGSGGGVSGSSGLLGSPHQKKLRFQLAKEKKASTTLGIIMSAFTICWLPFFILALIRPFVESETVHVPHSLSSLFLWLGYANSLLNPIIYATLNRDFRKPFQLILHLRCSSLNTMMRENYYQDQYGEPPSQRVMLGDERHGARESFL